MAWATDVDEEKRYKVDDGIAPFTLFSRQRLDDIVKTVTRLPFGGTDCALPMLFAVDRNVDVDTFVICTDSQTWAGDVPSLPSASPLPRDHRHRGATHRCRHGLQRLSIAAPNNPGRLDVVGFDTPQRGDIAASTT